MQTTMVDSTKMGGIAAAEWQYAARIDAIADRWRAALRLPSGVGMSATIIQFPTEER